jgi:hypothetical protein
VRRPLEAGGRTELDLFTAQRILEACAHFNDGLCVEYKGNFDGKRQGPTAEGRFAFANSQGGVLIIGVKTVNGVRVKPIEGFAPAPSARGEWRVERQECRGNGVYNIAVALHSPSELTNDD